MSAIVGYSGTPLAKKLGVKESSRVLLVGAPPSFVQVLEPLPNAVQFDDKLSQATDIVHVFATRNEALKNELTRLRKRLRSNAMVWVSWPKKAAKVPTDISENTIRQMALSLGFVDIKVCAISEVWSGLKLVIRKKLR
jgi:hypothetical protein